VSGTVISGMKLDAARAISLNCRYPEPPVDHRRVSHIDLYFNGGSQLERFELIQSFNGAPGSRADLPQHFAGVRALCGEP
jgi:hypothetical protein